MKKKIILFIIGLMLFLIPLLLASKMIIEKIHTHQMHERYDIRSVAGHFPTSNPPFDVLGHTINIEENIINETVYPDRFKNKLQFANLELKLNNQTLNQLEGFPIRTNWDGTARYHGILSFMVLEDKRNETKQLTIMINKTSDIIKVERGRQTVVMPKIDEMEYDLYMVEENGDFTKDSFIHKNRNKLQTLLLNSSGTSPMAIGYYTNAWHTWPSLLFPIAYPFLMLIIGFILIIKYFPRELFNFRQSYK